MFRSTSALSLLLGVTFATTACGGGGQRVVVLTPSGQMGSDPVVYQGPPPPTGESRFPHAPGDTEFMQGMIPHHAQAVTIAGWAATHTTRRDVRVLAERIVVAQKDEIAIMQDWLRTRGEKVPAADATHHRMVMDGGMEHDMLMPGMLSDEELAQLNAARNEEFDRLFLTFMIRHHEGALVMVEKLFASHGAAQDDIVFKFASDVFADQTTEIGRMHTMLAAPPAAAPRR